MKDAVVEASSARPAAGGLERAMLDDGAALSKWLDASGVGARSDELGAVLRKSDSHGERVGRAVRLRAARRRCPPTAPRS